MRHSKDKKCFLEAKRMHFAKSDRDFIPKCCYQMHHWGRAKIQVQLVLRNGPNLIATSGFSFYTEQTSLMPGWLSYSSHFP